jgi:hypothetical protein
MGYELRTKICPDCGRKDRCWHLWDARNLSEVANLLKRFGGQWRKKGTKKWLTVPPLPNPKLARGRHGKNTTTIRTGGLTFEVNL